MLFASMPPPSVVAARAAEVLAASHRETSADKQRRIAELEERARLFGDSVKQSAAKKKLERKWSRFMLVHGGKYGFKGAATGRRFRKFAVVCSPLQRINWFKDW